MSAPTRTHPSRLWPAILVLAISLAVTGAGFAWARHLSLKDQRNRFDQAVVKFRHTIDLYFSAYLNTLNGLTGFYAHDGMPTPQEFHKFLEAQGLRHHEPGVFGMGFIAFVRPEDRAGLIFQARDQGVNESDLQFGSDDAGDYVMVHYDNLRSNTPPRLALHVFKDATRIRAMDTARDTGKPSSSPKLDVFLGDGRVGTNGFILYSPIYRSLPIPDQPDIRRSNIKGLTFITFSVKEWWDSIWVSAAEPGIDLEIFDGRQRSMETLWYDKDSEVRGIPGAAPKHSSRYSDVSLVAGLGREWTFYCASRPEFESNYGSWIPWLILPPGIAVSVALFLLTLTQLRARLRAEQLAIELREAGGHVAEERERLAVTLSSIADGVIALDATGCITLMNRAAEILTGSTQDAARGRTLDQVLQLLDPQSQSPLPCPVATVLSEDRRWTSSVPGIVRGQESSQRTVMVRLSPIHDPQGRAVGIVAVLQDVTEGQRLLQEQLRSSRLESVGLLAGGIAHDFNNILTAIGGNVSLASLEAKAGSDQHSALNEAEAACRRARDLTQQLLTFAKGGSPLRVAARIDAVIRESSRFATHGSAARCEFSLPDDLWPVDADTGQIGQVVQNIVINAVEAMPEGGIIRVSAANVRIGGSNARALPAGRYVRISIEDRGIGIRPEHLDKIFDPYFSTKQRGSGLGLATCYSILKHHEGDIEVHSSLGSGTRFDMHLPASDKPVASTTAPSASSAPRRGGHILIMDDEVAISKLLSRMLERLGYRVTAANEGAEAVRLLTEAYERGDLFDAVILDLTVPGGMGGEPALRRMRACDPDLRALVSSGYSSDPIMANYRDYGFQAVVPKPYGIDNLAKVLDEVLGPDWEPRGRPPGKSQAGSDR